ncbi:MAG: helix-turn-helix domain-containing protein [Ktedonobacteraceae bacterium]
MDGAESQVFGTLLRDFRERSRLTQEQLAHRIGKQTRASIAAWENGQYLPNNREVVLELARHLRLSEAETDRLLLAARCLPQFHVAAAAARETAAGKVAPVQEGRDDAAPMFPPHIPDEPYYSLPGREQSLEQLLSAFQDPQGPPAVVIDGLGGIGKTAFAVELARRAVRLQAFEGIVGESAKQDQLVDGEIIRLNEASLDFNSLLDAIARQLDHWEIPALLAEEKQHRLAQLLRQHPYLILVDNLESAANAKKLVAELRGFLNRSRALITSRERIQHDFVRPLSLRELGQEDSLFFLRKDLEQRGGEHPLLPAPRERLIEVAEVTGGAPLAMKLVVAQARTLDIETVLTELKGAGNQLYEFIFRQSWQLLSLPAQLILIYIGKTVETTVSWEELAEVEEITADEGALLAAVRQLIAYSLLDVHVFPNHVRYGIHQLTRQFVNTDLPRLWQGGQSQRA